MNLAITAAVFPVIFVGELPDKTMFASMLLSTRGRPGAVWLGAAAAFVVHVLIATTVGVIAFQLFPPRVVSGAVAVMFLAGAALSARDARRERAAGRAGADADDGQATADGPAPQRSRLASRTAATAFGVIFAAEWGDLTQMLTANLAAHYHSAVSVGLGALLALWSVAAIAVLGGRRLARLVHPVAIRAGTAALLAVLAGYAAWTSLA